MYVFLSENHNKNKVFQNHVQTRGRDILKGQ